MRFGLSFQAPESPGRSHGERFAGMFELIGYAESLGLVDVVWLAEIHFGGAFSLLSNPLRSAPAAAPGDRRPRHAEARVNDAGGRDDGAAVVISGGRKR